MPAGQRPLWPPIQIQEVKLVSVYNVYICTSSRQTHLPYLHGQVRIRNSEWMLSFGASVCSRLDKYCSVAHFLTNSFLWVCPVPSTFIAQMMVRLYLETVDQGLNHGWIVCSSSLIVVFHLALKGSKGSMMVLSLSEVFVDESMVPLSDFSACNEPPKVARKQCSLQLCLS